MTITIRNTIGFLIPRLMQPFCMNLFAIEGHGPAKSISIISPGKHCIRIFVHPVEISHASQVTLTTIAVLPVIHKFLSRCRHVPVEMSISSSANRTIAVRLVEDCMDGMAVKTTEDRKIFLSTADAPMLIAPVLVVIDRANRRVRRSLRDKSPLTISSAGRSLAHHLCPSVTVKVGYHKLRIVSTCPNILTQVNGPQTPRIVLRILHIELITRDKNVTRVTVSRVVTLVCRRPFEEKFILTVTVHISDGTVVSSIGPRSLVTVNRRWRRHMKHEIRLRPRKDYFTFRGICIADNLPTRCRCAFNFQRCRPRYIALIHFSILKKCERCIMGIALQQPPGREILSILLTLGNDKTTVGPFVLSLGRWA